MGSYEEYEYVVDELSLRRSINEPIHAMMDAWFSLTLKELDRIAYALENIAANGGRHE